MSAGRLWGRIKVRSPLRTNGSMSARTCQAASSEKLPSPKWSTKSVSNLLLSARMNQYERGWNVFVTCQEINVCQEEVSLKCWQENECLFNHNEQNWKGNRSWLNSPSDTKVTPPADRIEKEPRVCTVLAKSHCDARRFESSKTLHHAQIRYPSFRIVQQILRYLMSHTKTRET